MKKTHSALPNAASSTTGLFQFPNPSGGTWKRETKAARKPSSPKRENVYSEVIRLDQVKEEGFSITLERLSIKTVHNEEAMNVLLRNGWTIRGEGIA